DVPRVPAAAALRRPRLGQARRRRGALRAGELTVRLCLGQLLAHVPSSNNGDRQPRAADGRADVALLRRVRGALDRAAADARAPGGAAGARRGAVSRSGRKLMRLLRILTLACAL